MTDNRIETLLKIEIANKEDEIKRLKQDKYNLAKALNQSEDYRAIARNEAIREFAEQHKEIMREYLYNDSTDFLMKWCEYEASTDNLVKKMVGENNG